jgi:hypothetical protein
MECTQVRFAKYVNTLTFWYLLVATRRFISHHRTTKIARNDTAAISSPLSKKMKHFDVRHSPFALLFHESPKQHLATVVNRKGDQRPASNDYYPQPTDGIARVDSSPRPQTRDPDLAAAGDVTCAPSHRARCILAERPRLCRSRHIGKI